MENQKATSLRIVLTLALASTILLIFAGVVYATVITVDGNPSDWPVGSSIATDPDELPDTVVGIRDQYDLEEAFFTNSAITLYWRIDTYANTVFTRALEHIDICLDTDQSTATGYADNTCNDIGTDRMVRLLNSPPATVQVWSCNSSGCGSYLGSGQYGQANDVTEIAVVNSGLIGLTNGQVVSMSIYFDNQDSDNDDHLPDTGSVTLTVPGPTVITMSSVDTDPAPAPQPAVLGAAATGVGIAVIPIVLKLWRRKAQI